MRPLIILLLAACGPNEHGRKGTITTLPPTAAPLTPQISLLDDPLALTELAAEATSLAPSWVRDDLSITLSALEAETQDEVAALLVDLDEPHLLDEVAFSVAHLSPEVYEARSFYPEILVENARLVYARDDDLAYVRLDDVGEPGVGEDWYTTATYRVQTDDAGTIEERTIDRDVYYWYLVHPRMEDELPYYVDAWDDCASSECPTDPESGSFWRSFLWDGALEECPSDRECPVVSQYAPLEDVLWKGHAYDSVDNGAIGALIRWEKDSIVFGAGSERPIQPNRIYAVGCGNCGEWADMASAAARTALIPSQNVGARANDHTWNEFWDEGWNQWEPVNNYVLHYYYYADANGDYYRTLDGVDNDCTGAADDGRGGVPSTDDGDGDGWTVEDGDCHDGDTERFPGATETADGVDEDCDGVADEGTAGEADASDADGDGVTVAGGDCDDTVASTLPGADDPALSTNRLFSITSSRGDARIDTDRTEAYGTEAVLRIAVVDRGGLPIDGATATVFGNWSVYGYPEYAAWAAEGVTGVDGTVTIHVGEANPYGYQVTSPIGNSPPSTDSYYADVVEWAEPGETYEIRAKVNKSMPDRPQATETGAEADEMDTVALGFFATVTDGRIKGDGAYRGSSSSPTSGGRLDLFIVDEANYELFTAGEPFEARGVVSGAEDNGLRTDLSADRDWFLVAANTEFVSTTVIADIAFDLDGKTTMWPMIIGPGRHAAWVLSTSE